MTEKLEHDWVKEIFNQDELKQYAQLEAKMKSSETKQSFEKRWAELVEELNHSTKHQPDSDIGIAMGKKFMQWVNDLYGKEYAHLRTKKFEQGFGEGKGLDEVGFTQQTVTWLDKAMDAYWRSRISDILNQVGTTDNNSLQNMWDELMDEMYGNEEPRKQDLVKLALDEIECSNEAKSWLNKLLP